jgi:TonB-linked SusC/RagA family outer membrane protein
MKKKLYLKHLLNAFLLLLFVEGICFAQQKSITGTVVGTNNEPLPGVSVVIKGTAQGTTTNPDGKFTIEAGEEDVLIFSFVGYLTEEVDVGVKTVIDLALVEDLIGIEEVVVVGYGTVRKSDITGSLSSVTAEQIRELPIQNMNQAIQGRAAGVDVFNKNFRPGEAPVVRIRGNRSITASNEPLYVLDGIPVIDGINEINPLDIESIEVLKDASATAIYGSQAANGVILITTRRGKEGAVKVTYDVSYSFDKEIRRLDMMNGGEWAEMRRESNRSIGLYSTDYPNVTEDRNLFLVSMPDVNVWESIKMGYEWEDEENEIVAVDEEGIPIYNPDNVRTYDWQDQVLQTGLNQNHQLSITGGTENLGVLLSVGYLNQEGIQKGQSYKRINTRLNVDYEPLKWFKAGMSNSFNFALQDYGADLYGKAIGQLPVAIPYDSLGNFIRNPGGDDLIKNPLRDDDEIIDERRIMRFFGSYYGEINFGSFWSKLEGLRFRTNIGQDFKLWRRGEFKTALSSDQDGSVNTAHFDQDQIYTWTWENLLYYNKDIGVHSFGLTLLQSAGARRLESAEIKVNNLPYESQLWYHMQTTIDAVPTDFKTDYERRQIMSYMGRINYGLMDKYLLTATLRYDGSSIFYKDNRWDYFPSFALAWKINNEPFMRSITPISQLKLRFGYGVTGNQGAKPYETDGSLVESIYVFGDIPAKGYAPEKMATRTVGWEKTAQKNLGLDFGLFLNRISGTIDIYDANTYDLLLNRNLPAVTGYNMVRANVGKVRNRGIELTLYTVNINTGGGFKWETDLTFAKNKEEIVELYGDDQDDIGNKWFIGHPINSYYDYEYERIWQNTPEDSALMALYNTPEHGGSFVAGEIKVVDQNGDTIINTLDRVVLGSNVPAWTGGITNRISYKGFELSAFVYIRWGQGIYNRRLVPQLAGRYPERDIDYWTPNNTGARYPQPNRFQFFPDLGESLYYTETSFVKVRNITLSYTFPQSILSKVRVNSLRLYVMAVNPFLITDYELLDPEAQGEYRKNTVTDPAQLATLADPNSLDPRSVLNDLSTKSIVFGARIGL